MVRAGISLPRSSISWDFADSHHHALCPTCSPGRLARNAVPSSPCPFDLSKDVMSSPDRASTDFRKTRPVTFADFAALHCG